MCDGANKRGITSESGSALMASTNNLWSNLSRKCAQNLDKDITPILQGGVPPPRPICTIPAAAGRRPAAADRQGENCTNSEGRGENLLVLYRSFGQRGTPANCASHNKGVMELLCMLSQKLQHIQVPIWLPERARLHILVTHL